MYCACPIFTLSWLDWVHMARTARWSIRHPCPPSVYSTLKFHPENHLIRNEEKTCLSSVNLKRGRWQFVSFENHKQKRKAGVHVESTLISACAIIDAPFSDGAAEWRISSKHGGILTINRNNPSGDSMKSNFLCMAHLNINQRMACWCLPHPLCSGNCPTKIQHINLCS